MPEVMPNIAGMPPGEIRPGYFAAGLYQVVNIGTSAADLVLVTNVSKEVCEAIQRKLNIPLSVNDEVDGAYQGFRGDLETGAPLPLDRTDLTIIGDEVPELAGKNSGCFQRNYGKVHGVFYHVLLER